MKTQKSLKAGVLIVEDEKALAHALDLKLTKAGFETAVAYDGKAALAVLAEKKFSVILLDLMMPEIDGFGVLEAMKHDGNKTPVIVLTNLSQEEDADRAKGLGAKEVFVKTDVSIAEVVKRVGDYL